VSDLAVGLMGGVLILYLKVRRGTMMRRRRMIMWMLSHSRV
jgi:hypothetical protein